MKLLSHILLLNQITSISSMDPNSYNGGSAMAMVGKDCVAVAVDKRFGSGPQLVNIAARKVIPFHSHLLIAFTGLEGDVISLSEEISLHVSNKFLSGVGFFNFLIPPTTASSSSSANRKDSRTIISPKSISRLTSHLLYSKRNSPYYCEPLIIGLEREKKQSGENSNDDDNISYIPFICSQDVIGAQSVSSDFACCGVASNSMYGIAEAMWRPNLNAMELAKICGRAFLLALERDCLSGYGAVVYVITKDDGILEFDLVARND